MISIIKHLNVIQNTDTHMNLRLENHLNSSSICERFIGYNIQKEKYNLNKLVRYRRHLFHPEIYDKPEENKICEFTQRLFDTGNRGEALFVSVLNNCNNNHIFNEPVYTVIEIDDLKIGVSPDYLYHHIPVEIKTRSLMTMKKDWFDVIPCKYKHQMIWQSIAQETKYGFMVRLHEIDDEKPCYFTIICVKWDIEKYLDDFIEYFQMVKDDVHIVLPKSFTDIDNTYIIEYELRSIKTEEYNLSDISDIFEELLNKVF